jgi:hypothetical protein
MWRVHAGARMTVETQVAALATMSTAELAAEYVRVLGKPPRRRHPAYMRKRIGHALQTAAYGGLPRVAREVLDRLMADITLPAAPTTPSTETPTANGKPRVGTVLTREWRGQTVRVLVMADGFEWDGRRFGSLSAVAQAITGAKWNGRLFFGLVGRSKP